VLLPTAKDLQVLLSLAQRAEQSWGVVAVVSTLYAGALAVSWPELS